MSRGERKAMITRDAPELSLSRQCRLLSIGRSSFYYAPRGESQGGAVHAGYLSIFNILPYRSGQPSGALL